MVDVTEPQRRDPPRQEPRNWIEAMDAQHAPLLGRRLSDEQRATVGRLAGQQRVDPMDLGRLAAMTRTTDDPGDRAAIESVLARYPRGQRVEPRQAQATPSVVDELANAFEQALDRLERR